MTAIQKLTRRLRSFPEKEQEELATILLSELDALGWDKQIEADARAGIRRCISRNSGPTCGPFESDLVTERWQQLKTVPMFGSGLEAF